MNRDGVDYSKLLHCINYIAFWRNGQKKKKELTTSFKAERQTFSASPGPLGPDRQWITNGTSYSFAKANCALNTSTCTSESASLLNIDISSAHRSL